MTAGGVRQLPLDIAHAPALGREDFLAAASNQAALAWVERWPDWPGHTMALHALALHGPAGCGKTHLASIWRARSNAAVLTLPDLSRAEAPQLLGAAAACVVDAGDWEGAPPLSEPALLHLVNWIGQRGGHLLLCARVAPARWPVVLPDLRSRLSAMPAAAIAPPEDDLLAALLAKLFSDRQLAVAADVVEFLVKRMERSGEAAGRLVEAIDKASLAARRPITVPLAQSVLAQAENAQEVFPGM